MPHRTLRIYEMDIPRRDKPEETFHVTFYAPNENATLRGSIIVVHGCGENANRYRLMAKEALVPAGFTLVVPDLPGFGQTPGRPGVSSVEASLAVIDETVKLMAKQTKNMPIFLYGHSMGGNLVINYLLNQEEQVNEDGSSSFEANPNNVFHAAIVSSPWLKLYKNYPDFVMKIIRFIGGVLPNATTSSRLKLERLANDHKILQDREQDKFCHGRISYKMLADMWQSGLRALEHGQELHLPMLLMYGSEDQIVSEPAIEELAQKLPPYMNSVRFDGFMHEIHNMQEREAVYETMLEFLYLCLKRGNVPVPEIPKANATVAPSVVSVESGLAELNEEELANIQNDTGKTDPADQAPTESEYTEIEYPEAHYSDEVEYVDDYDEDEDYGFDKPQESSEPVFIDYTEVTNDASESETDEDLKPETE